ncbi:MAG: cyclodeaminase/cyclohydrolase family protein [Clostridia bacterium]|nr:cyclodeaminase/cyclohydrolase family protein [Clostridia bacterium]
MITDKSCGEFLDALASGSVVPGGGGASALCGALGAALGSMVCNLTLGKKKYADVQEDIAAIIEKTEKLRGDLAALVQADAEVFEPLSKAYGMPKDAPGRDEVMEKCLRDACDVPCRIMRKACEAIELHEELAVKSSRIAVSDVGVGAAFCRAALVGASLNVFINTRLMKDRAYAGRVNALADSMLAEWVGRADRAFDAVAGGLRG